MSFDFDLRVQLSCDREKSETLSKWRQAAQNFKEAYGLAFASEISKIHLLLGLDVSSQVWDQMPPLNLPWENVHFRPQQHQARSFLEEYGPEGGLHGAQRSYDPIPWKETSGVKTFWFLESIMQAGNSVQVEAGVACDRFMYVEHALGIPPSYAYRIQCLERFWKYRVGFCASQKSAQHQSVIMFMVTARSIILVVMVVINTTKSHWRVFQGLLSYWCGTAFSPTPTSRLKAWRAEQRRWGPSWMRVSNFKTFWRARRGRGSESKLLVLTA